MSDEMTEEQLQQVKQDQKKAAELKSAYRPLDEYHLDLIFRHARSHNGWTDEPVSDDVLHKLHDLTKMGATSMNCCPARFIFITSDEEKERLKPALAEGNVAKAMAAPVITIIANDFEFYKQMPKLFPIMDVNPIFEGNDGLIESTAMRNGTLQAGYFMLAARTLGLDCGPMSGFDNMVVDDLYFKGSETRSNFICCLGHGDTEKLFQRLPRFDFEEACKII